MNNISDMKESLAYVAMDFDAELYAARHNLSPLQAARRRLAFVAAASRHLDHDMLAAVCSMICGMVPVWDPPCSSGPVIGCVGICADKAERSGNQLADHRVWGAEVPFLDA